MTWQLWRSVLDARQSAPDDSGDHEETRLQAIVMGERSGKPEAAAKAYGMTGFRRCAACDVTWTGTSTCWCCGQDVSVERGGATTPPRKSPSQ